MRRSTSSKRILVLEFLSGGGLAGPESAASVEEVAVDRELLAAGLEMRDAIVADLLALCGVQVSVASAPGLPPPATPAGAILVAPAAGEPVAAFLHRVAPAHDACWVVAPETGGILGRLRAAVGDATAWIGCDAAAIALATSKSATLARLHAHGLPTPLAALALHRGRWIVKPDDGAGTVATRVHAGRADAERDLAARRAAGADATLEPFVEGEALSISMIVGANLASSARVVAINRQCIATDPAGWLRDDGVQAAAIDLREDARAPALHALARKVVRALPGLRGFVGIDLIWNEERGPVLIEVNPRVTQAYVGLSRTGRGLAADVLRGCGLAADVRRRAGRAETSDALPA
jgi:predicted ATP-grasp superfamily ATP-dependent carboligase